MTTHHSPPPHRSEARVETRRHETLKIQAAKKEIQVKVTWRSFPAHPTNRWLAPPPTPLPFFSKGAKKAEHSKPAGAPPYRYWLMMRLENGVRIFQQEQGIAPIFKRGTSTPVSGFAPFFLISFFLFHLALFVVKISWYLQ